MNEIPEEFIGPAMRALRDDRQRRFAWIMACGETNAASAARDAGYSDASSAAKVRAHYLMRDPDMLDAIEEASRKVLRGLAPLAIGAARKILEEPKHPQHARMIETVLDRTGFFAKTEHKVTVEHRVDVKELEDLARRLAAENGIAPERFIGIAAPSQVQGEVIEGEVVDEPAADA